MTAAVVPQVFDRVPFRRVRRQRDPRDVRWADQVVRAMVARTVPDQDGLHVRLQRAGQLRQNEIHDAGVQTRSDQPLGLTRRGTRCRQHIDEPMLRLPDGSWGEPVRAQTRVSVPC